mmetsp:Transcript_42423/g.86731  ORF Transcript_42423/g.86731 Transcript_42423/m.86731 type:complete len:381 (+) Transcript_42423:198-1340(+)
MAATLAVMRKKLSQKRLFVEKAKVHWQPELPTPNNRLADLVLGKFSGGGSDGETGEWQPRRVVYSQTEFFFLRVGTDRVIDAIPLHEIRKVEPILGGSAKIRRSSVAGAQTTLGTGDAHLFSKEPVHRRKSSAPGRPASLPTEHSACETAFEIQTIPEGYNSGRVYRLKAESKQEQERFVDELNRIIKNAIQVAQSESDFERSQERVRRVFHSVHFQSTVALLILANFIAHAAQHQLRPEEGSAMHRTLETLDVAFTGLFTVEVCLNAYGHWARPFFSDAWSVFDLVVVAMALLSFFVSQIPGVSILRVMRAFRVLRLFGRLKALRQIINALTASIVPVLNAFLIMLIVTSICASLPSPRCTRELRTTLQYRTNQLSYKA